MYTMSLLDALNQQANALDEYENKYANAMNNFDVEKQIYKQTDLAYKQGKQLANQVFSGQQLENLNLAVPAVYQLTKGAYGRYRAGKSIIPSREEVTEAVKNFGRGQFKRGAKATVDKLKGALPQDMADAYDEKYNGKLPENLDELQDHVNTLKDLATNKISATAKEVAAPVAEGAADIARRATGRAAPPADTQASRPFSTPEERARPLGPEPGEAAQRVLPFNFSQSEAAAGGPALVSPETLSLQSFHNANVKQFEGFPKQVKDILVERMNRMGVEDAETGGVLDPNKLQIHSDLIAEAAAEYGLPKATGTGGAPRSRGFNADLFYDPSEGVLKDRNTGEQVRDIARLGQEDLTPSQQYQQRSPEEDDRIFDNPNSTLSRVLPFTDPDVPAPSIARGQPRITEQQARQQRLAEDPASFVPEEAFRAPVRAQRPPDTQASRPFSTPEERARPLGPEPVGAPPLAPLPEGVEPIDRTEDRLVRLGADRPEEQPQSNEDFFRGLRAPEQFRQPPPPPPRETEALATAGGRTADIEDVGARRELRGPYGSTAEQASGTAPTTTLQARPSQTPVAQEIQQRLAAGDVERGQLRVAAEAQQKSTVVPEEPRAEEPREDLGVKTSEVSAEDAGGAAGGVAAIGEGILTATDKGLTGGEKAEQLGKEAAPLAAFAAGGPVLGGLVSGAEILSSGESGAQKAKQIGGMGAALGGAAAASAVIPGAGELILGAIGIGSLIKDAVERHEQNKEMEHSVPAPPRAPQVPGIAFDSAPVIDSSDFHAL